MNVDLDHYVSAFLLWMASKAALIMAGAGAIVLRIIVAVEHSIIAIFTSGAAGLIMASLFYKSAADASHLSEPTCYGLLTLMGREIASAMIEAARDPMKAGQRALAIWRGRDAK